MRSKRRFEVRPVRPTWLTRPRRKNWYACPGRSVPSLLSTASDHEFSRLFVFSQDCVAKVLDVLTVQNKDVRKATWSNKEIDIVNDLLLLTAKPVTYLVNLSEKDYIRKKNKWLPKIKAWIDENNPGDLLIPFSIALEERVAQEFSDEVAQKAEFEKLGTQGQLGKITTAGYASLHLIRYFTCGPQEVRAWTIREGTKAPQAAGVIHGDFEKNFSGFSCFSCFLGFYGESNPAFSRFTVCGEIMSYADLKEYGSEAAVKAVRSASQPNAVLFSLLTPSR